MAARVLTVVADRLVELDRLGRGLDVEAALLDRRLDVRTVGRGVELERRAASDPPPFGRPDRPTSRRDAA
jgi:hypothetical protein